MWSIFVLTLCSPLDICTPHDRSFSKTAGQIKIVPLVVGLPARETAAQAARGEIVLGGCISSDFDPKYVVTW